MPENAEGRRAWNGLRAKWEAASARALIARQKCTSLAAEQTAGTAAGPTSEQLAEAIRLESVADAVKRQLELLIIR